MTETSAGNVLLVEDDPDFGDMLLTLLERAGYEVSPCSEPLEALEAIREHLGNWDVVISDQTMPDMLGIDLIRAIKAVEPALPCILCTGYSHAHLTPALLRESGVHTLLHKPLDVDSMMETLKQVISEKNRQQSRQTVI